MTTIHPDQRAALFTLSLFMVILIGCASSPSKFYQLNAVQSKAPVISDVSPCGRLVVVIGPVRIPDYLDRTQIVTRSGKNELKLSEFDRWVGPLDRDVSRVLVEDISTLLPADCFCVERWTPFSVNHVPASYSVEVRVNHFEGTPGDSVLLKAQWGVFANDGSLLLKKESRISEQMNRNSYDALVATMSVALERLSHDIADGIRSTVSEGK